MKRYLVIIPARGGSKAIKDKNIIDLGGKPLIEYTITPALQLRTDGLVEYVIVSTDSQSIADIARQLGVDVPFLRPPELSTDTAKSIDYVFHALQFFEQQRVLFDAVMILQPTVPLRTYNDIVAAINIFEAHADAESLISVYQEEYICDLVMYKKTGDAALPLNPLHNKSVRRQEHGANYVRNGAVYITSVAYLRETRQIISDQPLCYEMPKIRSINIDTWPDLLLARAVQAMPSME